MMQHLDACANERAVRARTNDRNPSFASLLATSLLTTPSLPRSFSSLIVALLQPDCRSDLDLGQIGLVPDERSDILNLVPDISGYLQPPSFAPAAGSLQVARVAHRHESPLPRCHAIPPRSPSTPHSPRAHCTQTASHSLDHRRSFQRHTPSEHSHPLRQTHRFQHLWSEHSRLGSSAEDFVP